MGVSTSGNSQDYSWNAESLFAKTVSEPDTPGSGLDVFDGQEDSMPPVGGDEKTKKTYLTMPPFLLLQKPCQCQTMSTLPAWAVGRPVLPLSLAPLHLFAVI